MTGIYRSVRELAVAQAALGADVHIVAEGSWPDDNIGSLGVTVHEGGARQAVRQVHSLAEPGSVIHTQTLWRGVSLAPLLMGRRRDVAAVISPHNCLSETAMATKSSKKMLGWHLIFRRALAAHDLVIATIEQERVETLRYAAGLPVAVLGNVAAPPRPELLQVPKTDTVGFLGRIHPIKGVKELVLAWTSIAPPGWRLRIVGPVDDEAYAAEVRALAAAAGTIDIEEPLYGDDKWRFLASCSLMVLPSKTEAFANVIAEAFLAGTPLLASTGVPWPVIEQLGMGWRVEGSVEGLATMLRQAIATPEAERARMAAVGRKYLEANFSARAVAEQSLRLYEEARQRSRSRR